MTDLRGYILSVVASAIICAVVQKLIDDKSTNGKLISTICGIFMVFTLILPLKTLDFSGLSSYYSQIALDAKDITADGESTAKDAVAKIIKEKTEAYILDKAVSLGVEVTVSVSLNDETYPAPCSISIKGAVSPYVKNVLGNYITEQIGIPKEAQHWT